MNAKTMNPILLNLMCQMDAAYRKEGIVLRSVPTIEHLPNRSLTVLAGRPVSGKTKVLMHILRELAIENSISVTFMHFWQKPVELLPRVISDEDLLYEAKIRHAKLDDDEWQRVIHDIDELSESSLNLLDGTGLQSWEEAVENIKSTTPDIVLLADWSSVGSDENNHLMFQKVIARQLKELAVKLEVPVVVTATTTRESAEREDKRPIARDLDHYSGIFQAADQITGLYRPTVYEDDYDGENHIELRCIWGGHVGCSESGELPLSES